jgi:hypothetical protein
LRRLKAEKLRISGSPILSFKAGISVQKGEALVFIKVITAFKSDPL